METPPQRASLDLHRVPADVALVGDALENVHQVVQAQLEGAGQSTGPTETVSDTGTVSFRGASHPVAASEAADLLVWLDEREGGGMLTGPEVRAAACLRRVAGRLVNSDKSRTSIDEEDSFNAVATLLARFRAARTEHARVSVLDSLSTGDGGAQPSQLTLDLAAEGKKGLPTVRSGVTVEDMLQELDKLSGDPDTPARSDGDGTATKADDSFASEEEGASSPSQSAGRISGLAFMRGLSKRFTQAGEAVATVVENALNKLDAGGEEDHSEAPKAAAPAVSSAVIVQ